MLSEQDASNWLLLTLASDDGRLQLNTNYICFVFSRNLYIYTSFLAAAEVVKYSLPHCSLTGVIFFTNEISRMKILWIIATVLLLEYIPELHTNLDLKTYS